MELAAKRRGTVRPTAHLPRSLLHLCGRAVWHYLTVGHRGKRGARGIRRFGCNSWEVKC